jgi:hypothetical protein
MNTHKDTVQRAICLFFAAVIVASSLSMGALAGQIAFDSAVAATVG